MIQLDRDKSTQSRRQAHNLHRSHNQSADFGKTHHSGPGFDCLCHTCTQGRDLKDVPGVVKRESSRQDGLVVFVDQCHPQGHTINQAQIYLEVDIGKSVAARAMGPVSTTVRRTTPGCQQISETEARWTEPEAAATGLDVNRPPAAQFRWTSDPGVMPSAHRLSLEGLRTRV